LPSKAERLSFDDVMAGVKPRRPELRTVPSLADVRAERARRSFYQFVRQRYTGLQDSWHVKLLCEALQQFVEAVVRGERPRLVVTLPPRHTKSSIVSELLPAWILGKYPEWSLILSSYSDDLAHVFSRRARTKCEDPEQTAIFPAFGINDAKRGVELWETTAGGGLRAAGVGAGITGMGAHVAICDDLHKDREEAESVTIRDKVWEWYTGTLRPRMMPGGGILLVFTRWHEDDVIGRIEAESADGRQERFEYLHLPAIAEEDELFRKAGEPLHPSRYDADELAAIRLAVGEYNWSSNYQGRPAPREGKPFQDFAYHEKPDDRAEWATLEGICVMDAAYSTTPTSDFFATVAGFTDADDNRYEFYSHKARMGADARVRHVMETMIWLAQYGITTLHIEAHKEFVEQTLPNAMRTWKHTAMVDGKPVEKGGFFFNVVHIKSSTNKTVHILDIEAYQHKTFYKMGSQLVADMRNWTVGAKHDDLEDAWSWLQKYARPARKVKTEKKVDNRPQAFRDLEAAKRGQRLHTRKFTTPTRNSHG
jgi:hypothetical protein